MELRSCIIPTRTNLTETIRRIGVTNLKKGPWVAGGAARAVFLGEELDPKSDIDIFTTTHESHAHILRTIDAAAMKVHERQANKQGTHSLYTRFPALTRESIELKIQVIGPKYFSTNLNDLFKIFDFTVCQFATDGHQIIYTAEAEHDVRRRVLALAPLWSVPTRPVRITRYLNYGFTPEREFFRKAYNLDKRVLQADFCFDDVY
jgi:hypothetical protein